MDLTLQMEQARLALASDPQKGLEAADRCIRAASEANDPGGEAHAGRLRGQALRALGRHADAIVAFGAAATAARSAGDSLLAAQVRLGQIDSLGMVGRTAEAVALGKELERTLRSAGAIADAAKALCNLGSLYLRSDRYAEALDCYGRAEEIFATTGDALMQAVVQVNQAIALTYRNEIDAAIGLYDKARSTYALQGRSVEAAVVETNLGLLHHVSGRHAGALTHLNRAHLAFIDQNRPQETARCEIERGDAYRALNLLPEALGCYERAIEVFDTLPLDYDRARAEMGRAAVLFTQQQTEAGMAALDRAERLFLQLRNTVQRAHLRLVRATALSALGRTEEAVLPADAAARTFARRGLSGWAAEARFITAAARFGQERPAVRQMGGVCRTARIEGRGWLECRAEHALGRYYAQAGKKTLALRHLRQGVLALESARTRIAPEEMHIAFLRDKQAIYEDMVALLLQRGRGTDIVEALECVERSRSRLLLDRIGDALEQGLPLTNTLRERLAAQRAELSRAYRQVGTLENRDSRRLAGVSPLRLMEIERRYAAVLREAELQRTTAESAALIHSSVPVERLQAALTPQETLLSFCLVRGIWTAFAIRHDEIRVFCNVALQTDIVQATRRLRYHLQKMQMMQPALQAMHTAMLSEMKGVLNRLYDLLLRPLESALAGSHLIVIPQGDLHGLPFHAFHDGARYALDRWEITYAPSAAIWHRTRTRQDRPNAGEEEAVLLVGVPAPGIERVASEVKRLSELLPHARTLVQQAATVEAVKAAAGQMDVLHLATHALFRQDNPHFSGIQLANGWLLACDLYDMPLPCSLVTLSACETMVSGIQSGDEIFGLVRGFLVAGARAVVGSYWPADDFVTAELMAAFYAGRQRGMTDGSALRCAQQKMRETYPHPYYWAAFGLTGHSGIPGKA